MKFNNSQTFVCGRGIDTVVEVDGVLLSRNSQPLEKIGYPNAAIWDFATRQYRYEKLVRLMKHIDGSPNISTNIDEALSIWLERDYLKVRTLASD